MQKLSGPTPTGSTPVTVSTVHTLTNQNVDAVTAQQIKDARARIVDKYPELANAFLME